MDNIETIIEVIFVVIFLFGRHILRLLLGGKKTTGSKKPKVPPQQPATTPKRAPARMSRRMQPPPQRSKAANVSRRPGLAKQTRPAAGPSLAKMSDTILAAFEVQQERARSIATTCSYRNFTVLRRSLALYNTQIDNFITKLADARDQQALHRSMMDNYANTIQVIDERLSVFESALNERTTSYAAQFNCADQLLEDVVNTCRQRHRGGDTLYPYLFSGVLLNPGILKGGLFGVVVPEQHIIRPREWSHIVGAFHETMAKRGKYATKIAAELGLPMAGNSITYFLSSGRVISAGLISSWMTWIYADVAATLQLGEAYALAMLTKCEQRTDQPEFSHFAINRRSQVANMPLISRLVTVHAVLRKMAVFDMAEFETRLGALISQHPEIAADIEGRGEIPLTSTTVNGDLFQVAASLVDTPLSILGNYTVEEIAGTDFGPGLRSHLQTLSENLRHGTPQYDTTPTRLAIASQMALQTERNAESRIEKAVLASLQPHKTQGVASPRHRFTHQSPRTLADVFSPEFLPQTVMIGAVSKTRGGVSGMPRS